MGVHDDNLLGPGVIRFNEKAEVRASIPDLDEAEAKAKSIQCSGVASHSELLLAECISNLCGVIREMNRPKF
jgi:hypothetical protein